MEYITKDDLIAFESRIMVKLDELRLAITDKPVYKSVTMSVADVQNEFGYSQHKQRLARRRGLLPYKSNGIYGIEYLRNDVEGWIKVKR